MIILVGIGGLDVHNAPRPANVHVLDPWNPSAKKPCSSTFAISAENKLLLKNAQSTKHDADTCEYNITPNLDCAEAQLLEKVLVAAVDSVCLVSGVGCVH